MQLDPIYVDMNPSTPLLQTRNAVEGEERKLFLQGARVEIILEDGLKYPCPGVVKRIDNRVQEDVGTIAIRAEFPNPEGLLFPGMFVRAFVEEGVRQDGKLVPQQAVFRDPKGGVPFVWIVRNDSTIERRTIDAERTFGNMRLVDSGLKAGERVVVEGAQFVDEGTVVDATEDESVQTTASFEK